MKRLIWKIRFAVNMDIRTNLGLCLCFDLAGSCIDNYDGWKPSDAVLEELSYFGD